MSRFPLQARVYNIGQKKCKHAKRNGIRATAKQRRRDVWRTLDEDCQYSSSNEWSEPEDTDANTSSSDSGRDCPMITTQCHWPTLAESHPRSPSGSRRALPPSKVIRKSRFVVTTLHREDLEPGGNHCRSPSRSSRTAAQHTPPPDLGTVTYVHRETRQAHTAIICGDGKTLQSEQGVFRSTVEFCDGKDKATEELIEHQNSPPMQYSTPPMQYSTPTLSPPMVPYSSPPMAPLSMLSPTPHTGGGPPPIPSFFMGAGLKGNANLSGSRPIQNFFTGRDRPAEHGPPPMPSFFMGEDSHEDVAGGPPPLPNFFMGGSPPAMGASPPDHSGPPPLPTFIARTPQQKVRYCKGVA